MYYQVNKVQQYNREAEIIYAATLLLLSIIMTSIYAHKYKMQNPEKKRCLFSITTQLFALTSISKPLDKLCHCTPLLSNSNIDTIQFGLLIFAFVKPLLVDDCVNSYSSFSGNLQEGVIHIKSVLHFFIQSSVCTSDHIHT